MKNVAFLAFGATLKQLMLLTLAFIASNTAVKKGLVSSQMITVSCFNTVIEVFFQKCLNILLILKNQQAPLLLVTCVTRQQVQLLSIISNRFFTTSLTSNLVCATMGI